MVLVAGLILIALVVAFSFFRSFHEKKQNEISVKREIKDYPKITAAEIKKNIAGKEIIQILDIRSSDEYQLEHITGSTSIDSSLPLSNFDPDKTTVIVGNSSDQETSDKFFEKLKKENFKNIFILSGGFSAWKSSGGNTISIGNPRSFTDQSKVRYITSEDLKKIIDNQNYPKYILDIRPEDSFLKGHLPGAKNISLENLEKATNKIPLEKEIFVYGDTDLQGFQGGVRLFDLGFFSVEILKGGMTDWKTKNFSIEK